MNFPPPRARVRQSVCPVPNVPANEPAQNAASIDDQQLLNAQLMIAQLLDAQMINSKPNDMQPNDMQPNNTPPSDIQLNEAQTMITPPNQKQPVNALSQQEIIDSVLQQYMFEVKSSIKKKWLAPRGNVQVRVVVLFRLHRKGDVSQLRLQQSSGSSYIDMTCLKAVEMAVYLPKIPDILPDFLDVQFVFEYGFDIQAKDEARTPGNKIVPPMRPKSGYTPSLQLPAPTDWE